jgi:hypothetical protein
MAYECFIPKVFSLSHRVEIRRANEIISEYAAQGFRVLTVRQIYYQFVSRDWIPNTIQSYKRLASILNDARLAGEVDWDSIGDNTRSLESPASWDDPTAIVDAVARQFRLDPWEKQDARIEVWIEKDALTGVIEPICRRYRVPYFACRGYTSQSEAYAAGKRLRSYAEAGQRVLVLHLGDHDPSGLNMTDDNASRLAMLGGLASDEFEFRRIALNMDQVEQYNPPPNPAKITDSRARGDDGYIARYGHSSWELDALSPSVIADLIEREITPEIDQDRWDEVIEAEDRDRELLAGVRDHWKRIEEKPWEQKRPAEIVEEAAEIAEDHGAEIIAAEIREISLHG